MNAWEYFSTIFMISMRQQNQQTHLDPAFYSAMFEDGCLVKDDLILLEEGDWVTREIRLDPARMLNIVFGKILFFLLENGGNQNVYGLSKGLNHDGFYSNQVRTFLYCFEEFILNPISQYQDQRGKVELPLVTD